MRGQSLAQHVGSVSTVTCVRDGYRASRRGRRRVTFATPVGDLPQSRNRAGGHPTLLSDSGDSLTWFSTSMLVTYTDPGADVILSTASPRFEECAGLTSHALPCRVLACLSPIAAQRPMALRAFRSRIDQTVLSNFVAAASTGA